MFHRDEINNNKILRIKFEKINGILRLPFEMLRDVTQLAVFRKKTVTLAVLLGMEKIKKMQSYE